ncbi:muscarinic acetylcholine receptor M2-like [Amphiura filiformis]|uniref:muscarinic acetylcholine receptor M2-like n=1 Tax=Amphiura filiformis TaxID=82378 RepID=UPI003B211A2A
MPSFCVQLLFGYWPLGPDMCVLFTLIDITSVQASNQSIVMLSIDRYISLAKPLWHLERRTTGRVVKFMCIAYGLPLLLCFPIAIYLRLELEHLPPGTCVAQLPNNIGVGIFSSLLYWIPFVLLLIININTYYVIRARREKNATLNVPQLSLKIEHRAYDLDSAASSTEDLSLSVSELVVRPKKSECHRRGSESYTVPASRPTNTAQIQRLNEKERKAKESERRAARTLTLLVMVMLITGTPWAVMVVVTSFCPTCVPWYLYEVSLFLTCLNSAANPWCYAAGNESVRQAMMEIVRCKWLQRAAR